VKRTEVLDPESGLPLGVYSRGGAFVAHVAGVPETVRILGADYRVRFHANLETRAGEGLLGCCSWAHRLILVNPAQPRHSVAETLAHECAHVYLHEASKADPHLRKLKPAQVEAVCDLIAAAHLDLRSQLGG
jgi:hypothetical protein